MNSVAESGDLCSAACLALLNPNELHDQSITDQPSRVPRSPGVYAWYFAEVPPRVPTERCHRTLSHTLLYVGIAPKETRGATTTPSNRTLRNRLRDHFRGNAECSTLRQTLGCLLSDVLGIKLRRVGSQLTFTNAGEQLLDEWMAKNARVVWAIVDKPWEVERALLTSLSLPLNLRGNKHPFVSELQTIRRDAKAQARLLPIVMDNGGERRARGF